MWGNKMIEDIRKIVTYEEIINIEGGKKAPNDLTVSYTHLRAHET